MYVCIYIWCSPIKILRLVNVFDLSLNPNEQGDYICFGIENMDYSALHSNTPKYHFCFMGLKESQTLKNYGKSSSENVDKNENEDSVWFTQKNPDVVFLCYCTCSTETTIRTHRVQLPLKLLKKYSGYSFVELLQLRFTFCKSRLLAFFYLLALRAGGVLLSRFGRAGGRLPNLRNPYLCNSLTDFLHSKFCGIV